MAKIKIARNAGSVFFPPTLFRDTTQHAGERFFMKRSKVRVGLSIVVIAIACGVAGFELKESLGPDGSSEAQIRKLESYWPLRRRAAAIELAHFGAEADKVVPALVKALGDSDREVRVNAIASLQVYGEKSKPAGPVLLGMLKQDLDGPFRQQVVALLGVIKDQEAVPMLAVALGDRDPEVRIQATRSLGRFGSAVSSGPIIDSLLSALGPDNVPELREASVETLDSFARDQERVARAIADLAAKDPSPEVRYTAVGMMKKPRFEFQVPALVAALEDPSARVRLAAGSNLAWIGMTDDRTVPALCRAALTADSTTREGVGINIDVLILERPNDKTPDDQVTRRYLTAANEFRKVLENRDAAAREQVINVLGRLIASYQKSGKSALREPARAAVLALLARVEDEKEAVPLRLHAMNQCSAIHVVSDVPLSGPAASRSGAAAPKDELHYRAMWIAALGRALSSAAPEVRSRAMELLMDNFKDRRSDLSFREAWRKIVPAVAEATKSEDARFSNGALAILGMLGPEAEAALTTLRSLPHDAPGAALGPAVEGAIHSITSIEDLKSKDSAVRIAAARTLGRLDWPAARGLPALITTLKDPETKVRLAAANALGALGQLSEPAVQPLAAALAGEADPVVRVGIVEALDAIGPGAPAVLDAHLMALRDPDPAVRKAGATFRQAPVDDSVVSALETALGDPNDEVRTTVAGSLAKILFVNPMVVPALMKALADDRQKKGVAEALSNHLAQTSEEADFRRVRGNLPGLKAVLTRAMPAIGKTLSKKDEEIGPLVYGLLGRIVSFARQSRDADLRKAIEPALEIYLQGLDESTPAIREEVLGRLDAIPIRRDDIVRALHKFLEKPDLSPEDRQTADADLNAQSTPGGPDAAKGSRRQKGAGKGLARLVE